jgi:hypothetical protein
VLYLAEVEGEPMKVHAINMKPEVAVKEEHFEDYLSKRAKRYSKHLSKKKDSVSTKPLIGGTAGEKKLPSSENLESSFIGEVFEEANGEVKIDDLKEVSSRKVRFEDEKQKPDDEIELNSSIKRSYSVKLVKPREVIGETGEIKERQESITPRGLSYTKRVLKSIVIPDESELYEISWEDDIIFYVAKIVKEIQWIEEVDRYLEHEEYYINWYYDWAGDEGVDGYMSERFYTSVPSYGYTGRGYDSDETWPDF